MNITIKKGSIKLSCERSDLVQVEETPDGVVFNLRSGIHLYLTDNNMPSSSKQLIKSAADNFENGDIEFELSDYNKPARVTL